MKGGDRAMGMLKKMLPTAILSLGVGALGYVIGGVAEPFVTGVTPEIYSAIGFLLSVGYGLSKQESD